MTNYDIQVADNFFTLYTQKEIIARITSLESNWQYVHTATYGKKYEKTLGEYTNFSIKDASSFVSYLTDSEFDQNLKKQIVYNIEKKFNVVKKYVRRVMFVYYPPDPTYPVNYYMPPHVDDLNFQVTNFLYYINDNDAETIFYDKLHVLGEKPELFEPKVFQSIQPKQGRAILFDGRIYHSANVSRLKPRLTLNVLLEDHARNFI